MDRGGDGTRHAPYEVSDSEDTHELPIANAAAPNMLLRRGLSTAITLETSVAPRDASLRVGDVASRSRSEVADSDSEITDLDDFAPAHVTSPSEASTDILAIAKPKQSDENDVLHAAPAENTSPSNVTAVQPQKSVSDDSDDEPPRNGLRSTLGGVAWRSRRGGLDITTTQHGQPGDRNVKDVAPRSRRRSARSSRVEPYEESKDDAEDETPHNRPGSGRDQLDVAGKPNHQTLQDVNIARNKVVATGSTTSGGNVTVVQPQHSNDSEDSEDEPPRNGLRTATTSRRQPGSKTEDERSRNALSSTFEGVAPYSRRRGGKPITVEPHEESEDDAEDAEDAEDESPHNGLQRGRYIAGETWRWEPSDASANETHSSDYDSGEDESARSSTLDGEASGYDSDEATPDLTFDDSTVDGDSDESGSDEESGYALPGPSKHLQEPTSRTRRASGNSTSLEPAQIRDSEGAEDDDLVRGIEADVLEAILKAQAGLPPPPPKVEVDDDFPIFEARLREYCDGYLKLDMADMTPQNYAILHDKSPEEWAKLASSIVVPEAKALLSLDKAPTIEELLTLLPEIGEDWHPGVYIELIVPDPDHMSDCVETSFTYIGSATKVALGLVCRCSEHARPTYRASEMKKKNCFHYELIDQKGKHRLQFFRKLAVSAFLSKKAAHVNDVRALCVFTEQILIPWLRSIAKQSLKRNEGYLEFTPWSEATYAGANCTPPLKQDSQIVVEDAGALTPEAWAKRHAEMNRRWVANQTKAQKARTDQYTKLYGDMVSKPRKKMQEDGASKEDIATFVQTQLDAIHAKLPPRKKVESQAST
ncbi:hypothetical protein LTR17_003339 [Elasticomyces elasticus]|nr:hypothetical protein LTR17_003339 [Elasticomyces elasticus]